MAEDFSDGAGYTKRTRPYDPLMDGPNLAEPAKAAPAKPVHTAAAKPQPPAAGKGVEKDLATHNDYKKFVQEMGDSVARYASAEAAHSAARAKATDHAQAPVQTVEASIGNAMYVMPNEELAHFRKLLNKGEITQNLTESGLNAAELLKNSLTLNSKLGKEVFQQARQDPLGTLDIDNNGRVTNYELAAHAIAWKSEQIKGASNSYLAKVGTDPDHMEIAAKVLNAMRSQPKLEGLNPQDASDFAEKPVSVPRPPQGPSGYGK